MTENSENLVLEHLRAIRGTLNEHGERLERVELRLAAIEQTLGSLYSLSGSDRDAITHLARRIERIEQRLNLSDT
jgi:archaellum component FlaC